MATTSVEQMERSYRCRYERGTHTIFPVTHVLETDLARRYCDDSRPAFAHVQIGNLEHASYRIMDVHGATIVHGSEQNHARTRIGYVRMLRRVLRRISVDVLVARRVFVRDAANRPPVAGKNPWTDARWLAPMKVAS